MALEIDFARLTLQDALDLAVLIEEEAEERYQDFADQMDATQSLEAARFFRFMSGNEARHGRELRARRQERFGDARIAVHRGMLWDVEAPAYERAQRFMSARQALVVARESEVKAHDYFALALPHVTDPEVRSLFEELRLEEVEHQRLVDAQLAAQPPGDDRDPELNADEPGGMEM
jgi:erythrin-vacuolar iron transport family protein